MKLKKMLLTGAMCFMVAFLATGCSGDNKTADKEEENIDLSYPISIAGHDILVRETKIGELIEEGFAINVFEKNEQGGIDRYEIDMDTKAEPDTYYSGGTITKDGVIYASIALVTDKDVDTMKDSVIARLEVSLGTNDFDPADVSFAGIPLSELTFDKANEELKGIKPYGELKNYMAGSNDDYDITLSFDNNGLINNCSVDGVYDVDWRSGNEK